ncbi:MAG: flagellar export protein FliJ [Rhizobiaceae bacterium]|jgi:dsDNA-specific endonuclease/ATPase MutS2|nr:flagellar export protein FliJ [Rhizobiaceae bacterium]
MKSRENLLRLKHFQVEDKTRQLTQIDLMLAEFEKMHSDLQEQISIEEEKAGITDPAHFAYPTFAKAARSRQENLEGSMRDLKEKRINAEAALAEAEEALKKAQRLEQRDGGTGAIEDQFDDLAESRAMIG